MILSCRRILEENHWWVPNHARAWYGLGMSTVARSDFNGARDFLDKLKRQDPKGHFIVALELSDRTELQATDLLLASPQNQ